MRQNVRTRPRVVALVVLSAALAALRPAGVTAVQSAPFTIEQLLSAPFTSEIVASPASARVAWVLDEQGARNVWVADGPAFARRRVTSYRGDDGQEITGIAFTPDGATMVYVRGGAANRAGEIPNPTSETGGAEQAVWAVAAAGGAPRKIGTGGAVAVAPRGGLVAFVSARGTHAFVGVLTVATGALTWLQPSLDLTAMGLARASDMFAAGVDLHGVHDWNNAIRNFMPGYNAERRPEVARLAAQSSPMAFVDGWRSPVLLIHGDDDRNVPFAESVELVEQLRARKVHVEQLVFPDEVHGFLLNRSWLSAYAAAADFLDRHLRSRTAPTQP